MAVPKYVLQAVLARSKRPCVELLLVIRENDGAMDAEVDVARGSFRRASKVVKVIASNNTIYAFYHLGTNYVAWVVPHFISSISSQGFIIF